LFGSGVEHKARDAFEKMRNVVSGCILGDILTPELKVTTSFINMDIEVMPGGITSRAADVGVVN
jgi:hypothetical protein